MKHMAMLYIHIYV